MEQSKTDLNQIAQTIQEMLSAETVIIALADRDGETIHYLAGVGKYAEQAIGLSSSIATSGLCGYAMNAACPVLVTKTEGDSRVRQDYVQAWGITTALATPFFYNNQLLGAVMVLNSLDGKPFDSEDEKKLTDYASIASAIVYQYSQSNLN